jgi:hypothetical protein
MAGQDATEWGHLLRMTIEIVETAKMAARKSPFLRHIALRRKTQIACDMRKRDSEFTNSFLSRRKPDRMMN